MLKNLKDSKEAREAMLSLLPTSGTLAGISIGLVGVINSGMKGNVSTIADDVLLVAALGFLFVCYMIFFAIRHEDTKVASGLMHMIDITFLFPMTLIVFSGFIVVYEFM